MGTTTDRTLVDSGEGTYVWDYSQDACPDMVVSLYTGAASRYLPTLRVLQRQEKSGRIGVEGGHDTLRASGTGNKFLI